jgi:cell division initiation protein
MPITPLDIRKKTFAKVNFRGVDPKEVRDFLDQVARDMEAIFKERSLLAEKVDELSAKLEGFTRTEKAFQEAFLTAQKACADMKENAKREAATILDRAKLDAERLLRNSQEQAGKLNQDLSDIRMKRQNLLVEFRGIIESFSRQVNHWEDQEKPKPK